MLDRNSIVNFIVTVSILALLFGFDDPGSFAVRLSVMIGVIAAGIIGFFLFRLFS